MKKNSIIILTTAFLICSFAAAFAADTEPAVANNGTETVESVVTQKERGLVDWTQNYIEATGMAVAPKGFQGAQARALARRGAIVDLQRNLLEFLVGVQVDSRTIMDDFMAEDRVRSEVNGVVKNVEVLDGEWDGEAYTVTGRIKLAQVRAIVTPSIKVDKIIIETEEKQPEPKKTAKYTGLIIDVRHLSLVPAMTFRVFDEGGRAVYGIEFVNETSYLQSGMCAYYNNINYAKGEIHVAPNPISTKAVRLTTGNVDIVIPNSAASMVRASSYDFRKECKVLLIVK